jgi:hypothetical protein
MLGWAIQVTAVSLCFIAVIHYLYIFFKTTLTVPKVKDLVNRPQQQYDELFKGIEGARGVRNPINATSETQQGGSMTTSISSLPPLLYGDNEPQPPRASSMKDELKQFVKKLNGVGRGVSVMR